VVHNDDTDARAHAKRDPSDERTGVFTSGIVSVDQGLEDRALLHWRPATAGENLAEVLKQRSAELPSPIQMCDALSRQCSEVACRCGDPAGQLPCAWPQAVRECGRELPRRECRYVLEMLGQVYVSRCRSALNAA